MTVRFLRWFTLGVLLVALGLATAADAVKSRGLTVSLKASEATDAPVEAEVELYSKSYALVIGIDDYTAGWPRLGQAVKDARNVAKALEGQGFEVTLETNLKASALEKAFKDFFILKGADPDARLFVWFAGHGHTDQRGEGYLIPSDGALERSRVRFLRTALSLRDFGKFVRYAQSKHVFTVFDSCFAGTIFNVARAAPPPQITRITTEPVRQFLTSGDAGQTVSDDGIFAKLFIEALQGRRRADGNGDGYLTASEMGSFLDAKMSNYTQNKQTPRYGKLRSPDFDKGDFVFRLATMTAGTRKLSGAPAKPKFSLEDLKKQQSLKENWATWQQDMNVAFKQVMDFEGEANLKVEAWDRFLAAYAKSNPYSEADDELRARGKSLRASIAKSVDTNERQLAAKKPSRTIPETAEPSNVVRWRQALIRHLRIAAGQEETGSHHDGFHILAGDLFLSPSVKLTDKGRSILQGLAQGWKESLTRSAGKIDWILRVEGHTDRWPIKTKRFPSNMELSKARADTVVKFLVREGVSKKRLLAVGLGDTRREDTREDEIAARRNRRVEFRVTLK